MDLRYYKSSMEQDLRIMLEHMAGDAIEYQNLHKQEKNELVSQTYRKKALALGKQMENLVCGMYQKEPENTFYNDFLRETAKVRRLSTTRNAVLSEEISLEASKNTLIRTIIRRARRMSNQKTILTEAEFGA